jgi:hypothetical protein
MEKDTTFTVEEIGKNIRMVQEIIDAAAQRGGRS